jgi:hypothetical protein
MEFGGRDKAGFAGWFAERKPIILAAVGGFVAAAVVGALFLMTFASGRSAEATPPSVNPATPTTQFASRGPITPAYSGTAALPAAEAPAVSSEPAPSETRPVEPAPAATSEPPVANPPAPALTPAPRTPVSTEAPPLPPNFEYDPQWGFPAPPKDAPKPKRVDPVIEPTPPGHVLAMNPYRRRDPQFVMIVPNRMSVSGQEPTVSLEPVNGN